MRKVFNSFDKKDYMVFIHRLNPIYKVLSAQLFLERRLDEIYDDI